MTLPLTERQEALWRYIGSCERSPSYDEMADAIGVNSKSGIQAVLAALKHKGFVTYTPYRARSVVALDPQRDLASFTTAELARELARRLAT